MIGLNFSADAPIRAAAVCHSGAIHKERIPGLGATAARRAVPQGVPPARRLGRDAAQGAETRAIGAGAGLSPNRAGRIPAYNECMPTSSPTVTQRFVLEIAKRLPREAAEHLVGGAYDADEPARTEADELNSYYPLSNRMAALSAAVLREFPGLGAYATAIERQGALSADGAAASEETLRTARSILDEEPPPVAAAPIFVRGARMTLMQAQKAIRVAATYRYGSDDAQDLHRGAAAASQALAAAQGFVNVPEEAHRTVEAMRGNVPRVR
jgi:hypothetical protein